MDWNAIKAEYLQGGISYRQLAKKYSIPMRTLARRASEDDWATARQQIGNAVATDVNTIIQQRIEDGSRAVSLTVYDAAEELLQATMEILREDRASGKLTASSVGQYAAALRSMRITMQRPSELDLEEQRARIEKLRRESQHEDDGETGVIFLPRRLGDQDE